MLKVLVNKMPSHIRSMSRILSKNMGNVLNFGIILLTYFESYLFPLAIIKWMIVVTRYGGIMTRHNGTEASKTVLKSRYKYKLQLLTIESYILPIYGTVEQISHVSISIEDEDIQVRLPPLISPIGISHTKIYISRCLSSLLY